jgi:hypothetical protein
MAHINGVMSIINGMRTNINSLVTGLYELSVRISNLESGAASHTSPDLGDIRCETDMLKAKVLALEGAAAKERALTEATILAKTEDLVKRVIKEHIAAESQAIADTVKAYVDEQLEQHANDDTASVAMSEMIGGTIKRRGRQPSRKPAALTVE